ncbi:hypothetical protein C8Q74DRAFT_1301293, partial [Fomes fomentarius]
VHTLIYVHAHTHCTAQKERCQPLMHIDSCGRGGRRSMPAQTVCDKLASATSMYSDNFNSP